MPDKRGNLKVCLNLEALSKKNHRTGTFLLAFLVFLTLVGPAPFFSFRVCTLSISMKKGGMQIRTHAGKR
jgi:hypothetical protein